MSISIYENNKLENETKLKMN